MSATSLLARIGLRSGTLGLLTSLAYAAPQAEGDLAQAAHTYAGRTGWFHPTATSIGFVTNGAERMRLWDDGGVQIGGAYAASPGAGVLLVTNFLQLGAVALPGSPATGMVVIDSGDSNKLKWYDGSGWQTAGGGSIGGSIAANQVAYGFGVNTIQGSAALTFSGTNLTVTSGPVATTTGGSSISSSLIYSGTMGGDSWGQRTTVVSSGTLSAAAAVIGGEFLSVTQPASALGAAATIIGVRGIGRLAASSGVYGANATFIGVLGQTNIIADNTPGAAVTAVAAGVKSEMVVTGAGVSTSNIIPSLIGFWSTADVGAALGDTLTITNLYDLYLAAPTNTQPGTVVITNRYGIYQADPLATNVLKGALRFDGSTSGSTTIQSAAIAGGSFTLTLPVTAGAAGNVLSTDGAGVLSWIAAGSGTPAGANTQVQYNNTGAFAGSAGLLTDGTTVAIGGAALSTSSVLVLPASTLTVSSLRITQGVAPTAPVNGDVWATADTPFIQLNGGTAMLPIRTTLSTVTGVIPAWATTSGNLGDAAGFVWAIGGGGRTLEFDGGTFTSPSITVSDVTAVLQAASSGTTIGLRGRLTSNTGGASATAITAAGQSLMTVGGFGANDTLGARYVGHIATINASPGAFFYTQYSSFIGALIQANWSSSIINSNRAADSLIGTDVELSCVIGGTAFATDIPTIAGIRVLPGTFSATTGKSMSVDNYYGIYLGTVTPTGAFTITNRYGIYQADATAINVLKGVLRFDGSTSGSTTIQSAAIAGGSFTLTLPVTAGAAGNVLSTDGAGVLSWIAAGAGTIGGSIAANQIAVGSGVNTIGGAATLTATTTAGALLVTLAAGTSTATTNKDALRVTITYSGANTTSPMTGITGVVTSTATPGAAGQFTYGIQGVVTVNPGGVVPSTSQYTGVYGSVTASSRADTNFTNAVLYGMQASATFTTADTSGSTIVTSVAGLRVNPSVGSTNAIGTSIIPAVYGVYVVPGAWTSSGGGGLTVTNYYGLYLGTVTLSTTTITNNYGIYQVDTTAKNNFGGYTVINHGTDAITTTVPIFQVVGTFSGNLTTGPVYGISSIVTSTGAISTASLVTNAIAATLTVNPGGAIATHSYIGLYSAVTVTSRADTNVASGTIYGAQINPTMNTANTSGATVLSTMYGIRVLPVVTATNVSGTNTVGTVYGVAVTPGTWNCNSGGGMTVGTYYGLYLGAVTLSTTTITNNYGLYQADAAATNFFVGKINQQAGTVAATTTTTMINTTVTFSGAATTGPMNGFASNVTSTGTIGTASITTNGVLASVTATPGGAVSTVNYTGLTASATATSQANTNMASATLLGAVVNATFNNADLSSAAVVAAVVGIKINPSVVTTNASGTSTIASVYGAWVKPGTFSSTGGGGLTIANYYGLYLDTVTLTTMTITNRYGIYQSDAAAQNYWAGNSVFVPKALPTSVTGMLIVDSGDNNLLKWYNGTEWMATGGKLRYNGIGTSGAITAGTATAPTWATSTGSLTLPANYFTLAKRIRVSVYYKLNAITGQSTGATVNLLLNSINGSLTIPVVTNDIAFGRIIWDIGCASTGAGGTQSRSATLNGGDSTTSYTVSNVPLTTFALDTTVAQALSLTGLVSSTGGTKSITFSDLTVEEIS